MAAVPIFSQLDALGRSGQLTGLLVRVAGNRIGKLSTEGGHSQEASSELHP